MHEAPTDAIELVFAWIDRFRSGDTGSLAWVLTRPFTYDASGSRSSVPVRGLRETLELSRALARAFPDLRLIPQTLEAREHRIVTEAWFEGRHTGPLDLTAFDRGVVEPTGRRLIIGPQTIAWDVIHQRIHHFGVVDGPGLGVDLILEELERDAQAEDDAASAVEATVHVRNAHPRECNKSNGQPGTRVEKRVNGRCGRAKPARATSHRDAGTKRSPRERVAPPPRASSNGSTGGSTPPSDNGDDAREAFGDDTRQANAPDTAPSDGNPGQARSTNGAGRTNGTAGAHGTNGSDVALEPGEPGEPDQDKRASGPSRPSNTPEDAPDTEGGRGPREQGAQAPGTPLHGTGEEACPGEQASPGTSSDQDRPGLEGHEEIARRVDRLTATLEASEGSNDVA